MLQIRGSDLDKINNRHDQYLKQKKITCGVASDNVASQSVRNSPRALDNSSISSRVINGEPITNPVKEHPWLAKIYTKINTQKPMNGPKFKKHPPYTSTGTIITHKTILTCGHCVCNYKDKRDGQEQLTCKANKERHPSSSADVKEWILTISDETTFVMSRMRPTRS